MYFKCCSVLTWLVWHETAAVLVHVLCTPYDHAPVYCVTYSKPHARGACGYLASACFAEWPGSFTCYCGNAGMGMDSKIAVSTESWPWRRKFSCRSIQELNMWHFDWVQHPTTELPKGKKKWSYKMRDLPLEWLFIPQWLSWKFAQNHTQHSTADERSGNIPITVGSCVSCCSLMPPDFNSSITLLLVYPISMPWKCQHAGKMNNRPTIGGAGGHHGTVMHNMKACWPHLSV